MYKKKPKVRRDYIMDLLILVVFMSAPLWATAILCKLDPTTGFMTVLKLPFIIAPAIGVVLDCLLLTVRFMGERWW